MNYGSKKDSIVGSESELAKPVLDEIYERNDEITTISRRKNSSNRNKVHFCVDLSNTQNVIKITEQICKKFDVMVYFPAIFNPCRVDKFNDDQIINEINVNLVSAVLITKAIIPKMIGKKKGKLLFLGSSSSYAGFKNTSIYSSTKHGLLGFCRSLSEELRDKGIKVSCIAPGLIKTKMAEPVLKNHDINTLIAPKEISDLINQLIYNPPLSMWQEEIILKRTSYK